MNTQRLVSTLALVTVAACGGTRPPKAQAPTPAPVASTSASTGTVAADATVPPAVARVTEAIFRNASRARHLSVNQALHLKVIPSASLVQVVRKQVQDDVPRDVIRAEGLTYEAIGLVPAGYDYENETYALLEEQLAGLYMPSDQTMYVAAGIDGDELEATLAHELVHALQDQHFKIGDRMKYVPGEGDSLAAVHALAEGDATSAMFDELIFAQGGEAMLTAHTGADIPDKDPEELLTGKNGGGGRGDRLHKTPRFLSVGLLAPYADGMRFVNGLRRRGGWPAVDAAWNRPPISTEQLLHLEKYDANERPLAITELTAHALGAGFTKIYDDVFGEQQMRLAFTEWVDVNAAKRAAAGWGGDRVVLFEKGPTRAVAWRMVFDNVAEAAEAFEILSIGWRDTFGEATWSVRASASADPELAAWGEVPEAKTRAVPTGAKGSAAASTKSGAAVGKAGGLPPLPAPSGVVTSAKRPAGCRALRRAGAALGMVSGAPCAALIPWVNEIGAAP